MLKTKPDIRKNIKWGDGGERTTTTMACGMNDEGKGQL